MYKLISKDTIEEGVLKCAESKLNLEENVAGNLKGKYLVNFVAFDLLPGSFSAPLPSLCFPFALSPHFCAVLHFTFSIETFKMETEHCYA